MSITVTDVTRVLQMLEASRNASRFADTIEYVIFTQVSGITECVTFCSKLFVPAAPAVVPTVGPEIPWQMMIPEHTHKHSWACLRG
jgi:hypothetical protein